MTISQIPTVASDFACLIINKFDQCKFPEISGSELPTISTNDTDYVPDEVAQKLPPALHSVLGLYASNFKDWLVMSGSMDPRIPKATLNNSAVGFFKRMGIDGYHEDTAWDQLKEYVFNEAFKQFSDIEKSQCFGLMDKCGDIATPRRLKMRLFALKMMSFIFAVPCMATSFFDSPGGKMVIGTAAIWQSRRMYRYICRYLEAFSHASTHYAPKMIKLINDNPAIAKVVSKIVDYVRNRMFQMFQGYYFLWVTLICVSYCVKKVAPTYVPWLNSIARVLELPARIMTVAWMIPLLPFAGAAVLHDALQPRVYNLAYKGFEAAENKIFEENKIKAYCLWMHLLANPKDLFPAGTFHQ